MADTNILIERMNRIRDNLITIQEYVNPQFLQRFLSIVNDLNETRERELVYVICAMLTEEFNAEVIREVLI